MKTNSKQRPLTKLFLAAAALATLATPIILGAKVAAAQSQPAPKPVQKPSFDVASIKEWQPNQPLPKIAIGIRFSPGSIYAPCSDLWSLVRYAYHLSSVAPITGLPDWAKGSCGPNSFSIEATMPLTATEDQARLMMQTLLEDRFKMRAHLEKKEMQVFFLVIEPGGLKRKPADFKTLKRVPLSCPEDDPGCSASFGAPTMSQLADSLSMTAGRPVIDKTGLTEAYETNFMWASNSADTSSLPSVATALRDKLGLLLKPQTAPVDILVIDHVEKPSPN